jgi:transposase-like protein
MANQYTAEPPERAIAVKLLTKGLATVSELANHYGLARQTVQRWAEGIDVAAARKAWIARAVERSQPRKT